MPVEKKYIKLAVAGLAVTALVIGLSVGLTQKNKAASTSSAASAAKGNQNTASASASANFDEYCYAGKSGKSGGSWPVGGTRTKSGKSGDEDARRKLVVPGTEEFHATVKGREELRGELMSSLVGSNDRDLRAKGGKKNQNATPTYSPTSIPTYSPTALGDYDYSSKAKKSGKGEVCFDYDPCDPTTYPDSAAKSGKSGSTGVRTKSVKIGSDGADSNSVKARGKNKKADYEYDYDYDYDEAGKSGKSGTKSGKSGSYPFCPCGGGKSGKSGNKSGKSGNKSGKSPEDFECDLSCLPTLCPGPSPITLAPAPAPCVCADLPFIFVGGVCQRGCGVSEDGPYANAEGCCNANFAFPGLCNINDCGFAPPCVCEELPFTLVNGQCTRDCAADYSGTNYATESECCDAEFPSGGCSSNNCGNPQPTFSPTYSPTSIPTYTPTQMPVAGLATPQPTAGSTPTVSTEATGPPTKSGRSDNVFP